MVDKKRDKRWSEEIQKRNNGKCPCCAKPALAGAHHIIPRENMRTRYLIINGINTCNNLHRRFEDSKEIRDATIERFVGWKRYGVLEAIANGMVDNARYEEVK